MTRRFLTYALLILIGANLLAWQVVFNLSQPANLEVSFLDVGQGDAVFINTSLNQQVLIDGGPDSLILLEKLGERMPVWDRTIDLVILTHPERDHLTGLMEVLKRYQVENILWSGFDKGNEETRAWIKLISEEGAKIWIAKSRMKITAGRDVFKVIYPLQASDVQKPGASANNTSVVIRLTDGQIGFLFTGDIGKTPEKEIIASQQDIQADILKVSHHGSKTSSSEEFIKAVSPLVAIISVGKDNKYGLPSQEVLEMLAKSGIRVLRTDQDKDITITSDSFRWLIDD